MMQRTRVPETYAERQDRRRREAVAWCEANLDRREVSLGAWTGAITRARRRVWRPDEAAP